MTLQLADHVVMVVFGLLIGVACQLFAAISGVADRSTPGPRQPFKQRFAETLDVSKTRARNREQFAAMPRSGWLAMVAFYGLIGMLVLVVTLSPLTMRWWPFLGAALGGYVLADLLFGRTRRAARRSALPASDESQT